VLQSSIRGSLAHRTGSTNPPHVLSRAKPCSTTLLQPRTEPAQSRASESRGQTENAWPWNGSWPVQSVEPKPLAFLGFSALSRGGRESCAGASWRRERTCDPTFSRLLGA
jgi:hypothetical protein